MVGLGTPAFGVLTRKNVETRWIAFKQLLEGVLVKYRDDLRDI